MKIGVAVFLGISITAIAVFGFFAMGHESGHGICIARTLQGRVCADTDILGVASYHLSAFEKAMRAVAADAAFSSIFSLAFAFLLAAAFSVFAKNPGSVGYFLILGAENFQIPQKFLLRRWSSLKENSPNFTSAR